MRTHTALIRRARPILGILAALFAAGAASAAPVPSLQADACFNNMAPRGVYPIVVGVQNAGPSADGALTVKSVSYSGAERDYHYPISLPTGSEKRVTTYPWVTAETAKISVSFDGPLKFRGVDLAITNEGAGGPQIGMIGDLIGGLSGLRAQSSSYKPEPAAGYVDFTPGPRTRPTGPPATNR